MTEAEWLTCSDPQPMLNSFRQRTGKSDRRLAGDRKLRLFNVACCRRIWHLFPDERSRAAVASAERYADGRDGEDERRAACEAARTVASVYLGQSGAEGYAAWAAVYASSDYFSVSAAYNACVAVYLAVGEDTAAAVAEAAAQAELLRDIVGNPFRAAPNPDGVSWREMPQGKSYYRTAIDPAWLTEDAKTLAQVVYRDRGFDRMPELADALAAAGCGDEDILGHCHEQGRFHVRGCWVLDLLLGKS